MRQTIFWSTTAEKLEQRKISCAMLSQIYDIEWKFFDNAKPSVPLISEQNHSSTAIYIFELNTDSVPEQLRAVEQTFRYSQKHARSILLIGLLTEANEPEAQTFNNWLAYLDGVITKSAALADAWALVSFTPFKYLRLPATKSQHQQQQFVESFSAFIRTVLFTRMATSAMNKVSDELLYLGVEDDVILIDSIAELLSKFWS